MRGVGREQQLRIADAAADAQHARLSADTRGPHDFTREILAKQYNAGLGEEARAVRAVKIFVICQLALQHSVGTGGGMALGHATPVYRAPTARVKDMQTKCRTLGAERFGPYTRIQSRNSRSYCCVCHQP